MYNNKYFKKNIDFKNVRMSLSTVFLIKDYNHLLCLKYNKKKQEKINLSKKNNFILKNFLK